MNRARRAVTALVVAGMSMTVTATATAATATVTGDDGNPIMLGGPVTIRNMDVKVEPAFSPSEVSEKRDYTLMVLDPAEQVAAALSTCRQASGFTLAVSPEYRGNGTYTVLLTTYPDTERSADGCKAGGAEQRLPYTVAASTAVGPLPAQALLREPNSFATRPLEIPVQINPGSLSTEVRYAAGGVIGPDGGISGASESASVNSGTGRATAYLRTPGRYVVVARARADNAFTPWSAPAFVTVLAPFDLESFRFTDSRGPSYRVSATLREKTATGRVRIDLARGTKRGRYKRLGTVTIRNGVVSKRFRQRRTGRYRMRLTYGGGPTTTPGAVVQEVRFTRRLVFR